MDEQLNTEKNIIRELEDLIKHHSLNQDKNIYIAELIGYFNKVNDEYQQNHISSNERTLVIRLIFSAITKIKKKNVFQSFMTSILKRFNVVDAEINDVLVLSDIDLSNTTFSKLKFLANLQFINCTFTGSSFVRASIPASRFINCNLSNCDFRQCNMRGAEFENSDFVNSNFSDVNARKTLFVTCDLSRISTLLSRKRAVFLGSIFEGCSLDQSNLSKADFRKTKLFATTLSNIKTSKNSLGF
jgi:uncharacterized protein YjbI with pentapeptide repeats